MSEVISVIATRMHHRRKLKTQPEKALVRARHQTHETCENSSCEKPEENSLGKRYENSVDIRVRVEFRMIKCNYGNINCVKQSYLRIPKMSKPRGRRLCNLLQPSE